MGIGSWQGVGPLTEGFADLNPSLFAKRQCCRGQSFEVGGRRRGAKPAGKAERLAFQVVGFAASVPPSFSALFFPGLYRNL